MISLQNISKQFGGKYLFRDLSLHIGDKTRVAIVGPNGAGKSTLMKIITGLIDSDSGKILRSRFDTCGYLPQDNVYHSGFTLYEETAKAFEELNRLNKRHEEISNIISGLSLRDGTESSHLKELVTELAEIQEALDHLEGYNTETRIKKVLFGLGFKEKDMARMTEEFSGGRHMRIELAKLLLQEPSVLLLDEPTNHLDIESLEWIENYLISYGGSIILVSHDSRFLDNLVERVVELSMGKAAEYTGNYSSYLEQKEQRLEIMHSTYQNQKRLIQKTSRFIERFRYKNTKAKQVQSRVKMLEKMDHLSIEKNERDISFKFPEPPRAGRIVMELGNIRKSYGKNSVFDNISLQIERGDRIALLGINGSGKSTLARIIAGTELFQNGERKPGHNAQISYYAQNMAEELDDTKTVIQTLDDTAILKSPGELRSLLGCFLFTDDDVFKPVSVLSGGEKSRLALAKMLLKPANLLIMDEPTNHLDIRSKVILQESLENYTGTYIIVSHDRDFLTPLIKKVVVLEEGDLDLYHGNVDDYLEKHHKETKELKGNERDRSPTSSERDRRREEAKLRQERYRKLKPLRDTLHMIESEIETAEKKKSEMEASFARQETYRDDTLIQSLSATYRKTKSHLEILYDKWSKTEEKIEDILRAYQNSDIC
ncbi:MAG: ABC-F family ATP-binding cassette domain-containing protein [Thermodesulfobacteriota bacterium]|nr:ABC-F family ATP-binding cassette domain-containing protein [Thermodesulfobacteriota bacterium]